MPVYNGRAYVAQAAAKHAGLRPARNFELLVIDDGSTDDTRQVVEGFRDPRVLISENPQNLGLVATLNKGLSLSRGDFIARMDADDISEPDRLAKQVKYLIDHPEVDAIGGAIQYFGNFRRANTVVFPTEHEDIRVALLFYCPLAHPTVMFRRTLIDRHLLRYSDEFRHAEDYHLWSNLLQHARAANLTDLLLRYRLHPKQVRSRHADPQLEVAARVRKLLLTRGGVDWTDGDIELHESIVSGRFGHNATYINRVGSWFNKLEQSNRTAGFWESQALHRLLVDKFAEVARRLGLGHPAAPLSKVALQYLEEANYAPERILKRVFRRAKTAVRQVLLH